MRLSDCGVISLPLAFFAVRRDTLGRSNGDNRIPKTAAESFYAARAFTKSEIIKASALFCVGCYAAIIAQCHGRFNRRSSANAIGCEFCANEPQRRRAEKEAQSEPGNQGRPLSYPPFGAEPHHFLFDLTLLSPAKRRGNPDWRKQRVSELSCVDMPANFIDWHVELADARVRRENGAKYLPTNQKICLWIGWVITNSPTLNSGISISSWVILIEMLFCSWHFVDF